MAEESAVKVCVRVRPTIEREKNGPSETEAPVQLFWKADKNSIYQIDDGNLTKSFSYDRVFTVEETTNQLYQAIAKPLVVSTVEGYNGTIFAYGQTSSGKTFTMMGSDHAPGVIPLAVEDVFNTIKNCPNKKFLLRVSYMEIYNETVTDLLVDSWKRKPLEVRETINKNIYVADLTEEVVKSPAQALAWIRKGEKNRHYEKTKMNQRSSRSHTIFRMILESEINADGAVIVSHLNLVDLAGSERASQTGAEGTRFKEGCNINRSLFTLGQVIKKLSEESQRGFTNYRDSKLTRILQNSLGGNAKTVIICTITAAALDETLSTLQFASTAKKMKNDPHVTEVSDDGALLKRYRNEIVELKRRLHEVSSVTQTTATEKEVLAQLLQEKDQLQKEQEDRIKNLTKLMVTSTNVAQVQRFPKRRVTWGGKMMRLSAQSACEGSPTNRSFAESATRKRKADRSCLMELVEYDDDFESHWEIPEEPSDDPDSSPSFVTVRGFESRTSCREAELESQLQTASQEKQQALEKAAEVDLQLQSEARQRSEAMAKVETLESSVAELKRQLEEQRHMTQESEKRMQIDFAETVQLCEDLSSEKDALASERNYLKQELGLFMEQTKILEKEVACLSRELEEKRETDEFKSLEEQFRNERENELQNEISSLKMEMESRQLQGLELQKSFETLSEELKQKTKCADDLQNMVAATQGLLLQDELQLQKQNPDLVKEPKDSESSPEEMEKLVSEVAALSAERDSLKMDLQENVDLMIENQGELGTALEKILALKQQIKQLEDSQASNSGQPIDDMTTEVGEIQTQSSPEEMEKLVSEVEALTAERDSLKMDLQENVDLMIENQGELMSALEKISALKQQIKQLEDSQASNSGKPVDDITTEGSPGELEKLISEVEALTAERDSLKMDLQENVDLMIENQGELMSALEKISALKQQIKQLEDSQASNSGKPIDDITTEVGELQTKIISLSQELDHVKAERDSLFLNKEAEHETSTNEIQKLLCKVNSLSEERDQLHETVEGLRQQKSQLRAEMEERMEMLQCELQQEQLSSAAQSLKVEQDQQNVQIQQLKEQLEKAKEEVTLLKADLQENVQLKEQLSEKTNQLEAELQQSIDKINNLSQEVDHVKAERDSLFLNKEAEHETSTNEIQKLLCKVNLLSEERDQLHETVEGLRQEKSQLRAEMEERMEMLQCEFQQEQLSSAAQSLKEEQEDQQNVQIQQLKEQLEKAKEEVTLLKADLQENVQLKEQLQDVSEKKNQLEAELQQSIDKLEQEQLSSAAQSLKEEQEDQQNVQIQQLKEQLENAKEEVTLLKADLQENVQLVQRLTGELEDVRSERDTMQSERSLEAQTNRNEIEKLMDRVTFVTEERYQLQHRLEEMAGTHQNQIEQLQDVSEKNHHLEAELQQSIEKINNLSQELDHVKAERDSLFLNKEAEHETSTNEIQKLLCKVNLLSEERDQLHETVEGLRQEKSQLRAEMEERMEMLQCEFQLSSAAQSLKEQEDQQNVQIQQLKEQLEKAEEEVTLLKADLQENVQLVQRLTEELEDLRAERDTMQSERSLEAQTNRNEIEKLMDRVTFVTEERYQLQHRLEEMAGTHQNQVQRLTEELEDVRAQRDTVQSERSLDAQTNRDELEKLMERVTFVNEERGQLQDQLEAQKRETSQLRTQLEEMAATHLTEKEQLQDVSEKKNQLETELQQSIDKMKHLSEELGHVKAERDSLCLKKEAANLTSPDKIERLLCQVTSLCEVGDQLHETVEGLRGEKSQLQAEMEERVAMVPNEAKTSNSLLNENQTQTGAKVTVSSCLQDSTLEFQKLFGKLQQFINVCSHMDSTAMKNWDEEYYLTNVYESNLTPPILEAHSTVCRLARETFNCLGDIGDILGEKAKMYKNLFDEFVKKDLSNFEEWNLLLGELQVLPSEDKANFSKQKLAELLVRRQFFLQKMGVIMETLYAGMTACCDDLSADKKGRLNFDEQLEAVLGSQPVALRRLDSILRSEVDRRSTVVESRKIILQGIIHDHNDLCGKVQQLQVQLECHLQKETSRRSSLQQSLGGARSKTKLEEAHKMNLQQLKAELLDVRSQVEKKENAIQVLKNQLQEKSTSPSAAQLEEVQAKLFKTEMEMSAAFDKHQKEIQRMTVALNDKDRSMWRLKETLRTLQQRGEGSFLQGEELHERLTNPRGLVVTSSVVMEKNKLEEEVKQLQLKIRHLENLVSSQQTEITKWKNRAVKLKVKSKQDSERSPTKCGFPSLASPKRPVLTPQKILDSPKQMLNSPKSTLLDSPKSRFFDGAEKSEILLRTCPKQFFDNSSLGTFSEIPSIPNEADTETDADTKDECSRSPRHEELCKMQ
uniref:centromere-associated protein E isoform X2 n=1 Tax=Doryrhamphus excisus TaxID=161450 RepID=UPI0025AE3516|nr:centromere-associated protein E isoform X2 [Doryrhamphus excisus]